MSIDQPNSRKSRIANIDVEISRLESLNAKATKLKYRQDITDIADAIFIDSDGEINKRQKFIYKLTRLMQEVGISDERKAKIQARIEKLQGEIKAVQAGEWSLSQKKSEKYEAATTEQKLIIHSTEEERVLENWNKIFETYKSGLLKDYRETGEWLDHEISLKGETEKSSENDLRESIVLELCATFPHLHRLQFEINKLRPALSLAELKALARKVEAKESELAIELENQNYEVQEFLDREDLALGFYVDPNGYFLRHTSSLRLKFSDSTDLLCLPYVNFILEHDKRVKVLERMLIPLNRGIWQLPNSNSGLKQEGIVRLVDSRLVFPEKDLMDKIEFIYADWIQDKSLNRPIGANFNFNRIDSNFSGVKKLYEFLVSEQQKYADHEFKGAYILGSILDSLLQNYINPKEFLAKNTDNLSTPSQLINAAYRVLYDTK